jgi:hypothetical protein
VRSPHPTARRRGLLKDVEQDTLAIGDVEVLQGLATQCGAAHDWRPLKMPLADRPFIRPRVVAYCRRCKLVDLDGWVFWPVVPGVVAQSRSVAGMRNPKNRLFATRPPGMTRTP